MTGSAIGPVITYLLAQLPGVLTAVNANAIVIDGPATPGLPSTALAPMLCVAAGSPWADDDAAAGARQYLNLGAQRIEETFVIPMYLYAESPGTDQAGARNATLTAWDAIVSWFARNYTMGGALADGRHAEIADVAYTQTAAPDPSSGEQIGYRWALISCQIQCQNHYIPS